MSGWITFQSAKLARVDQFSVGVDKVVQPEHISPERMPDLPGFAETFARQRSWEWNFGHAPAFSHLLEERFPWGGVELHFDVEKGVIGRAQIFSDTLDPAPLDDLAARLPGVAYRPEAIDELLRQWRATFSANPELEGFSAWLLTALR